MQFVTEPEDIKQTGSELFVYPSNDFNLLQPETVESLMILYRVTGNNIYREYGHTIMAAFEKHCKTMLQHTIQKGTKIEEGDSSLGEEEDVTEEEWKLRANPLITIIVPPGPCGLVLQVDRDESGAPIVDGFVRKYDGRKGTIENSGLVKKGSVLCAINDIDVMRMPLKEVIRTLNLSSHLERAFTFRNGFQHRNSM
ncbi:hypothetical protein JM16_000620 [Phytophthora kernoviae]|uniref:mannosyl-oligosaccharide 1,2-alpha-mannosidase n=1 Tax=Phytophthora kernoviae TaxID=325452 RepID=A0A8T0M8P1_9STRA|nr:hypothetical protein JM16_000620 [Phytophthora kernoviae]